jgi:putative ABC transport system permease protein
MDKSDSLLPRLGKALLWLSLDDEEYDQAVGDLEERLRRQAAAEGRARAVAGFWIMLFRSLPHFLWDSLYWRGVMLVNNLKLAWRVIQRQKLYSSLNILGLGVSLACLLMILFHVRTELSYEKGFPKSDRIFRVRTDSQFGSTVRHWAASAPAMGPELQRAFPEVEATARLMTISDRIVVYRPEQGPPRRFKETRMFVADRSFPGMFDMEFIRGDRETALDPPSAVVLTESFSRRYFGDEDPVGKILLIDERGGLPLQVTGVIRDLRGRSHLDIEALVSMPTIVAWMGMGPEILNHRTWKSFYTFVLLRPGQAPAGLESKAAAFMKDFHAEQPTRVEAISLQPIRSIHLHSKLEGEASPNSDITYVIVFSAAALLILLIAVVNFINLATAQSFKRVKEIGVRKVIGARRGQLIRQYLGEAGLLTVLSAVLAVVLLTFAIPFYNRMTGLQMSLSNFLTAGGAAGLLGLLLLLTFLAGLYPAFFATAFQPAGTLKGARTPGSAAAVLRKCLVVFQFVVSIFLVFGTITMARQLAFFHRAELGFAKSNVIALEIYGEFSEKLTAGADALKAEILRHSGVSGAALTSQLFGDHFSNERLTPVGTADKNALPMLRVLRVDADFIRTAGLTILQGRDFEAGPDRKPAYIISETTAAVMGFEQPLGVECLSDVHDGQAPIIGVIKDFHFSSLHSPIEPLVLEYLPSVANFLLVRAREGRVAEVLEYLKKKAAEISPDFLFSYEMLDDAFDSNYRSEDQSFALFKVFSALALFVACLGLFGLSVFAAERRIKEIGIRKALGASVGSICLLLSGTFLRWVAAANVVALPLAYLAMRKWLQNFAYHTRIGAATFAAAGLLVLVFAAVTVGYQALRSARENPVDSLRYE